MSTVNLNSPQMKSSTFIVSPKPRSEYGVKFKITLAPALKSRTIVKLLLVCKFNPYAKKLTKSQHMVSLISVLNLK